MEIREKNTFGDKVTSCLEHVCVIGSTDDMACVLGNHAFTNVCVLASYADTSSYTCSDTHQYTREKIGHRFDSLHVYVCVCVCVCVSLYVDGIQS